MKELLGLKGDICTSVRRASLPIVYIRIVMGVGGVPLADPFSLFSPLLWFNKRYKILKSGAWFLTVQTKHRVKCISRTVIGKWLQIAKKYLWCEGKFTVVETNFSSHPVLPSMKFEGIPQAGNYTTLERDSRGWCGGS